MKVAMTVWDNRVSPVFDAANRLLIAEIENETVLKKDYTVLNPELPADFMDTVCQLGISTLICGAISQTPADIIEAAGIELIPFISGDVETILACFSRGVPITPQFLMPGCGKMRHGTGHSGWQHPRKGKKNMPRGDGTGPDGQGPGTGRGKGACRSTGTAPRPSKNKGRGKQRSDRTGQGRGSGMARNKES